MTYNTSDEFRLYINICRPGEKIYMGFRQNNKDCYFRLKDPNGNIVIGPKEVPRSSADSGWIDTYFEAVAGPEQLVQDGSGYLALEYQPLMTGDYYIEFNSTSPTVITPRK